MTNNVFSTEAIKAKYPQIKEINFFTGCNSISAEPWETIDYVSKKEDFSLDEIFENFKIHFFKSLDLRLENSSKFFKIMWRQEPTILGYLGSDSFKRDITIRARLKISEVQDDK